MKSQTYPSGRTVTYAVDDAGRVDSVMSGTTTYADPTAYTADGRVSQMQLGNTLWETRDYHTPGTTTVFTLFELGAMGEILERLKLGYDYSGSANNGNLAGHTIVRSGETWTQKLYLRRGESAGVGDGGRSAAGTGRRVRPDLRL